MSISVSQIEYNRYFTKAIIALAKENHAVARAYFEKAALALNKVAEGYNDKEKDYIQQWLFDI
ncbi:MAG: hypothetical protein J6Q55_02480, partial [Clostridia bacterium]|nr:hypothetical protein [Clostridia bacterium]